MFTQDPMLNQDLGVKVATPIGTLFGQLLFGWLADVFGHKCIWCQTYDHHCWHVRSSDQRSWPHCRHYQCSHLLAVPHGHRYWRWSSSECHHLVQVRRHKDPWLRHDCLYMPWVNYQRRFQ
ncbi:hypothetical protein EDB86DRAFT_890997 [Lactarius hatsudake]|nr:hypothetical protein EDB86DRAFT_890997 [Lactarius hatsudake]